jgi:hypothetical protein
MGVLNGAIVAYGCPVSVTRKKYSQNDATDDTNDIYLGSHCRFRPIDRCWGPLRRQHCGKLFNSNENMRI